MRAAGNSIDTSLPHTDRLKLHRLGEVNDRPTVDRLPRRCHSLFPNARIHVHVEA